MSNYVYLTDKEMVLLDGKCSEKVQKEVDDAKNRLSFQSRIDTTKEIASLVADIVNIALKKGRLEYKVASLRNCRVCNKKAGYAKYTRNTRYHQKGESNYDRLLYFSGIDCEPTNVRIKGSANFGCCKECWTDVKPVLAKELSNIKACIPKEISGVPPKWKCHPKKKCLECEWEGHEGQMLTVPALMGGNYPGKCPECRTESMFFGPRVFETIPGFELVSTE